MCLNRWPLPCRRAAFYHRLLCACLINQQGCHGDGGGGAGPKNGPGLCAPWPTYSAVCQHIQRQTGWMGDTFTRITGGKTQSSAEHSRNSEDYMTSSNLAARRFAWASSLSRLDWTVDWKILNSERIQFQRENCFYFSFLTVNPLFACTFQTHQLWRRWRSR